MWAIFFLELFAQSACSLFLSILFVSCTIYPPFAIHSTIYHRSVASSYELSLPNWNKTICCYFRWHSPPPKQLRLPEMSQIQIYCNILALGNWKMSAMCVLYNFHEQFGLFKSSLGESIIIKIIGCIKLISFSSANSILTK